MERVPELPLERREMYVNLLQTVSYLRSWVDEAEQRKEAIRKEILVLSKGVGKIRIKEILYPGIKATIAGATMVVRDEYKYVTMIYSEGEVKMQPYR